MSANNASEILNDILRGLVSDITIWSVTLGSSIMVLELSFYDHTMFTILATEFCQCSYSTLCLCLCPCLPIQNSISGGVFASGI
jgi:hypothetical protein